MVNRPTLPRRTLLGMLTAGAATPARRAAADNLAPNVPA
jgi:hypothetical protein